MSDSTKKVLIGVVAALAVLLAIVSVTRTIKSQIPHDAGPLGGGAISNTEGGGKPSGAKGGE